MAKTEAEGGGSATTKPMPWGWRCSCGSLVLADEGHICWPARHALALERIAAALEVLAEGNAAAQPTPPE